ncbi:MAG: hypothetical protein ACI89D_000055 [Bermanella sp.]|jgi:hypothetical protein
MPEPSVHPMVDPTALRDLLAQLRAQAHAKLAEQNLTLAEALLKRADTARESVAQRLYSRVQSVLETAEHILARSVSTDSGVNCSIETSALATLLMEMREQNRDQEEQPLGELDQKIREQNTRLMGQHSSEQKAELSAEQLREQDSDKLIQKSLFPSELGKPLELRAARQFRQLQGRHAKRRKVQFALDNRPEDPGPLNPDMLAVQILRETQDASPAYLERLVSYLETLAALEQLSASRIKKTARVAKSDSKKKVR